MGRDGYGDGTLDGQWQRQWLTSHFMDCREVLICTLLYTFFSVLSFYVFFPSVILNSEIYILH